MIADAPMVISNNNEDSQLGPDKGMVPFSEIETYYLFEQVRGFKKGFLQGFVKEMA